MKPRASTLTLSALLAAAGSAAAFEFSPVKPMDTAQVNPALLADVFGAYEIRNQSGTKRCRIVLTREPAIGGMGVEVDTQCAKVYPAMADIAGWRLLEGWTIDLIDPLRKTRIRFETPDNRYVAFGAPADIAGMDDLVKVPNAPAQKRR
jgi:hypothetical protein